MGKNIFLWLHTSFLLLFYLPKLPVGSCWATISTSLSIKSAAAGDLLSAAECLSLLNVLHQGHPFQTHQFYFHFHFFLPRCLCGLWSSRSQLRHPISASHVSKREKCKLSKHRGKWICQGRTALLSLEMSRDIISTCVSMFVFAEVTSS